MSWRHEVEQYECGKCGAKPGDACKTATGNRLSVPHADRWAQNDNRCRKCGERLDPEDSNGDLCPRCALIRRLEIERVTHHHRRD